MGERYLGIDTSNYTTSVSLCEDGRILSNIKIPVPVAEGGRGIRQSDALFHHTRNLPHAFKRLGATDILAVGVSERPRDAEGSYMPCFLAGVSAASAISSVMGIPLYTFSHQRGHVRAAVYSSGMPHFDRFIAFHVSGGTTEMLLVENGDIRLIGKTADINAGQLIDRVGVRLGLAFPAGAALESICDFDGVRPRCTVKGTECNLSGLENIAVGMIEKGESAGRVAAFVIASIEKTLLEMTANAIGEYGKLPLLYAGGVMSNKRIKESFTEKLGAYFATPEFSADNAAGVALLCAERYRASEI